MSMAVQETLDQTFDQKRKELQELMDRYARQDVAVAFPAAWTAACS